MSKLKSKIKAIWLWLKNGEIQESIFKIACCIGVFCWLIWAFENCWFDWYRDHVADYFNISDVLANILLGVYVIMIITSAVIRYIYNRPFRKKEFWYTAIIVITLYIRYRFCSNCFVFKTLSFVDTSISYVDVVIVLSGLYALTIRLLESRRKRLVKEAFPENESFYYHDTPIQNGDNLLLGFSESAKLLVEKLDTLTRSHSWSIGIVGPWGSGKTTYINYIKQLLPEDKYIVALFNPRFAPKPSKIQELALDSLAEAIKPYNSGIRHLMRRYISALQLDGGNAWIQLILTWVKSKYDIEDIKNELDEQLDKLPKQVIFIFDDFDRLTQDEIIEVLKLIDGNAKFKNIIFIAAYDHDQVGRLLHSSSYIDKYFSIEIHVPLAIQDDILNYMKVELESLLPTTVVTDRITMSGTNIIMKHQDIFKSAIHTIRDAKRYLNALKMDIHAIRSDRTDDEDFMLLTLLKFISIRHYELLCLNPDQLLTSSGSAFIFDKKQEGISQIEDQILTAIFPITSGSENAQGKIRNIEEYYSYFVKVSNTIREAQPSEIFNSHMDENMLHRKIDYLCSTDELRITYFDYLEKFGLLSVTSRETLLRLVEIILYTNKIVGDKSVVPFVWQIFSSVFYADLNKQKHIGSIHKSTGAYIANFFDRKDRWTKGDVQMLGAIVPDLYRGNKSSKKHVISKTLMEPIIRKKCIEMCDIYVESGLESEYDVMMAILYICVESIDSETGKIVLDKEVCKHVSAAIKKQPAEYISQFVRFAIQGSSPNYNKITGEPFWKQIFGSTTTFQKFLHESRLDTLPYITRVRNFWRLYNANSYEPVTFDGQGDVKLIVENDFKDQMKELNRLYQLNKEIKDIPLFKDEADRIGSADVVLNELKNIHLDIALKNSLMHACESIILQYQLMK